MNIVNIDKHKKKIDDMVGGKASKLCELKSIHINVPEGIIISFEAYQEYLKTNNIFNIIKSSLQKIDTGELEIPYASKLIQDYFMQGDFPGDLRKELLDFTYKLDKHALAIRSSANTEDLTNASFAGQQDTYLNIRGMDNIVDCVKKCWASLWNERAIMYRQKMKFVNENIYLAVILQRMIYPEISGVTFTYNSISNDPREMVINATYGLGEAIASGIVIPDTIIYDKAARKITYQNVGSKTFKLVCNDQSMGQEENDILQREKICLDSVYLKKIIKICTKIEKYFKYPQDIEWAIEDGKIYVLQSRPISNM